MMSRIKNRCTLRSSHPEPAVCASHPLREYFLGKEQKVKFMHLTVDLFSLQLLMWLAERISIVFESVSRSEWKGNNDLIQTARLLGSGSAGQYIAV